MALLEINRNPSARELRQFAAMFLVFFGGFGAYSLLAKGSTTLGPILIAAAAVVGIAGLARPSLVRWLFVGWMIAAFPIGWTVSHLLLGAIYYLVITPIGLIVRATGRDPMNRRFDPDASSYWVEHERAKDVSRYFRQF